MRALLVAVTVIVVLLITNYLTYDHLTACKVERNRLTDEVTELQTRLEKTVTGAVEHLNDVSNRTQSFDTLINRLDYLRPLSVTPPPECKCDGSVSIIEQIISPPQPADVNKDVILILHDAVKAAKESKQ